MTRLYNFKYHRVNTNFAKEVNVSDSLDDYISAKEAAIEIGIEYSLLMARIYKGKIKAEKKGWATLIHRDEVARAKEEQQKLEEAKNAGNTDMEGSAG